MRTALQVPDMTILDAKKVMRAEAISRRARALAAWPDRAAERLASQDLAALGPLVGRSLSGYAPMADEIDVTALLRRLDRTGVALALPVIVGRRLPLTFRAWRPGDAMEKGMWGIAQPAADQPDVRPDVLLVPLLAFDRNGWRLGYGGGYFDRTLARLRTSKAITAVGVALDDLEVDAVPHLDYDQPLDWVLTPTGLRQFRMGHEPSVSG